MELFDMPPNEYTLYEGSSPLDEGYTTATEANWGLVDLNVDDVDNDSRKDLPSGKLPRAMGHWHVKRTTRRNGTKKDYSLVSPKNSRGERYIFDSVKKAVACYVSECWTVDESQTAHASVVQDDGGDSGDNDSFLFGGQEDSNEDEDGEHGDGGEDAANGSDDNEGGIDTTVEAFEGMSLRNQTRTQGANDADAADSPPSLQPDDTMPTPALAMQNLSESCPFASKDLETEVVPFAKEVVEKEFDGGSGQRYKNFQSAVVALLAYAITQKTMQALTMSEHKREVVAEMIETIVAALETKDCQMHAFKSGNQLAAKAKECVKAENTLKEKIGNIKASLDFVWYDDKTKAKVEEESKHRNLHIYQSEVYTKLGLKKTKKAKK